MLDLTGVEQHCLGTHGARLAAPGSLQWLVRGCGGRDPRGRHDPACPASVVKETEVCLCVFVY